MGKKYTQTLEPRLFYLYIPEEDQSNLPIFDTSIYDLSSSYGTLFYEDRFSGPDRMGDANQLTLSLTSRFNVLGSALNGVLTVGQAFFLEDREVILPGRAIQDEAYSPIIVAYQLTPFRHARISGDYQWDYENQITRKFTISAQYRPSSDKVVNLGYRVVRIPTGIVGQANTSIEQTDVSFSWPISKDWKRKLDAGNYDLPRKKSIEMFGGVEYNSCCWAFRAVGRRFLTKHQRRFPDRIFSPI